MNNRFLPAFMFAISAGLFATTPLHAETVYPASPPDHYLSMPSTQQQPVQTQTGSATSGSTSGAVIYSSDQYPTAQGKFLKVPTTYQPQAVASAPAVKMPVAAVVTPAPAPLAPPISVAAVAPPPPIVTPVAQPQIYSAAPKPVAPVIYPQASNVSAASVVQTQPVTPTAYEDMPSYTYNSALDPAHPTYKTPKARDPKANAANTGIGIGAVSGFEIGLGISEYHYREFDASGAEFIDIDGPSFSLMLDYTQALQSGWFYSGDFRLSYGLHHYTGGDVNTMTQVVTPATRSDIPDVMFDLRALAGHDFIVQDALWGLTDLDLSPYTGVGFRVLYEDGNDTDSNGVPGYDRYSHYLYLPIGITPRVRLSEGSRVSMTLEYDILLHGWQTSALNPDLVNDQNTGYGLRGNIMYERRSWSVGPFFEYWDIGQSTTDCEGGFCGDEPHNKTFESGIQAKYRF